LDDSLSLLEETAQSIRDVMADLRPPALDEYGLVAALRCYAERFSKRTGMRTLVEGGNLSTPLSTITAMALFRIAQEALTNVSKHGQASEVIIRVEDMDEGVCLTIADDGVGFDLEGTDAFAGEPGWGLMTMRERAEAVRGQLHVESKPGSGTRVIVKVPRA
jgi:signal transduction histidine kinase